MNKDEMKLAACKIIDEKRDDIIDLAEEIFANPELGYKEKKSTEIIANKLEELGLPVEKDIAVTGARAVARGKSSGPKIAVLGELDAVICREHPRADPHTGAVHACGHNNQVAAMLGSAMGLVLTGIIDELPGAVEFMAVPAEEYIELEYRTKLIEEGKIKFLGGKQELIQRGYFDDIDLAMMVHSLDLTKSGKKAVIGGTGNGFVGKKIKFIGKESHAGGAPEEGVNALNAAVLAMVNIHTQRETFPDEDKIRVHPIITKGGDIVNIVPADVRMETYVRGRTIDAILAANKKVNRALKAGAIAVGADFEITEIPGYLPLLNYKDLDQIFKDNLTSFIEMDNIQEDVAFTGSFDFGDLSHIIPSLHPFFGGIKGDLHTRNFKMIDPNLAIILPAKCMAMTVIDLLYDGETLQDIKKGFQPVMDKNQYLDLLNKISKVITE